MPESNSLQVGSLIISIIVLIIVVVIVILLVYNYNKNNNTTSTNRVQNPQEAAVLAALAYKNGIINGSRLPRNQ